ncbi:glutamyl-tRNA amidotransferase [Nocardiopsis sp. CNR-923]|uniref:GatB/YqeY domain-containing protein n=1 Tax=Nocardiopsis sp. CNR-923 TaxID=1904965 RepID=UPI0009621B75|nr:GatB/YqeY domain-containing protein [Nocardiopsis sp. CNR-923]OLT29470.1 glutamyl-tRNA amidotransferase [Nocardiopsis sp. CNR-923]
MSQLKDRLKNDLTTAIKARDTVRTGTLRMVIAAISTEEASGAVQRSLDDDEIIKLLTREAKKRKEAAEAFEKGGRVDQAAAERAENEVISEYLPAQLSDDELARLVTAAIAETGAEGPRAMGQVMKAVGPRVAGRAEGSRVAAEVKRQLA